MKEPRIVKAATHYFCGIGLRKGPIHIICEHRIGVGLSPNEAYESWKRKNFNDGWVYRLRRKIINHVSKRPPDFVIGEADNPYMHRWYLIPRNLIFNIYVHHFYRSDDDRALHDHPWINMSYLLQGEYTEHTIAAGGIRKAQIFRAGDVKIRWSGKSAHRVELHKGPCWTLFFTGPAYRKWGFHCPSGWRPYDEFITRTEHNSTLGKGCE